MHPCLECNTAQRGHHVLEIHVARDTDFLDLYRILGLTPDCQLAEFKQAYRRRVMLLHPDRRANGETDVIAAERLQQLTVLYSAAMTFQRQHGRLPGAAQARASRVATPSPATPAATPARRGPRWLLVLTGAGVVATLLWSMASSQKPAETSFTPVAARAPAAVSSAPPVETPRASSLLLIRVGTQADSVRHIEGEPLIISENRWEYGPSWVLFEQDRVVDWYSSPMRPLKTFGDPPAHRLH